jgi:hypothetical protein
VRIWRAAIEILTHVIFSCLVLFLSIVVPLHLLLSALKFPYESLTSFMSALNDRGRLSDVMLIILPLCMGYTFQSLRFAYEVGRVERDIPPLAFVFALLIPTLLLIVFEPSLFGYVKDYFDKPLDPENYHDARRAIIACMTSFVLLEFFMTFSRARSRAERITLRALNEPPRPRTASEEHRE